MSAEARTAARELAQWEGHVVNGLYPLRRLLGASDHSAVFLTGTTAEEFLNAAIKLVPAESLNADAQLAYWRTATALSHPNLMRLLDSGRCDLGGVEFLFVVMEYAEETLSQILPVRALQPDEVRELLLPTLEALAFLHRKNLVHGQLSPTNFLVVNDQLRLASDTIRPIGESAARTPRPSLYDPPEAVNGKMAAAGDIWGLGIAMVEALTQYPPTTDQGSETVPLPANFPPTFVYIVRQCLNRNPADRPTVADLEAQIKRAPVAPAATPAAAPPRAPREIPSTLPPPQPPTRRGIPGIVLVILILAVIWGGLRLFHARSVHPENSAPAPAASASGAQTGQPESEAASAAPQGAPPASRPASPPPPAPAGSEAPKTTAPTTVASQSTQAGKRARATRADQPTQDGGAAVVHQEIPEPSRSARSTIRGRIRVEVRVTVDRSGNVTDEALEEPGPSKYFARLSSTAARQWKFAPQDDPQSRQMLLEFVFTRDGTTGHTVAPKT